VTILGAGLAFPVAPLAPLIENPLLTGFESRKHMAPPYMGSPLAFSTGALLAIIAFAVGMM
jgi:hypothetical protein